MRTFYPLLLAAALAACQSASPTAETNAEALSVKAGWSVDLGLLGAIDNRVLTVALPREAVAAMLPSFLQLGTSDEVGPNIDPASYPVMFMFGTQQGVRPDIDGTTPTGQVGFDYGEFILNVPYLHLDGDAQGRLFNYFPRLFLDNMIPVVGGAWWGFAKKFASIADRPLDYQVRDWWSSESILRGQFSATGDDVTQSPTFARMRATLDNPVIGVRLGKPVCSGFIWDPSLAAYGVSGSVLVDQAFLPGLSVGQFDDGQSMADNEYGGFELVSPWHLLAVHSCD